MSTRTKILSASATLFNANGYESTSVAMICKAANVSNGSFFHAFPSKDALGAALYLAALENYHGALLNAVSGNPDAKDGIERLIFAHISWVQNNRASAIFLFEQAKADWIEHVRDKQSDENERFGAALSNWFNPLFERGDLIDMPRTLFFAQLIGPAQIICRAWLSGRSSQTPADWTAELVASAKRALIG